jgi:zinc protease
MVVVVVGAVDAAAVRAAVEARFGGSPRARLPHVTIPEEPLQLSARAVHLSEDVELTRAGMAWQVPGLTHPDAPALDLLAVILGAGDSSVLWQGLREKARLVHMIDAQNWCPGTGGLFCVNLTCDPGKRDKAVKAVEAALASFAKTGPAAGDMRKAIRQLVVGEINTRKTMSGQASRIAASEVVAGDLNFSRAYFERLRHVTPADLKRVVKQYLVPARLTLVSSNPVVAAPAVVGVAAKPGVAADFERITLPNGARIVWQVDRKLPNLHLRLVSPGGPVHEPEGRRGISALLATLLTKDTKKRSAARVAREIEEVGGSLYPFSGNNSLGLGGEALSTDVERLVSSLEEASLLPAFLGETLEIERESQLAELSQEADDIVTRGRKLLRARFLGGHPLAVGAQGDEAGVTAVTRADLQALHKRLFTAPNLVLAVSGDFNPDKLLPRLGRWMGKFGKGQPLTTQPSFKPAAGAEFTEQMQREQAVVFQAYGGPPLRDDDHYVAEVADELFSGMASRLFERVREEKGLAYFVRSARVTGLAAGMFYFYAGTAPDKAAEVLAEIEDEVARVAAGKVGPEEVARCQARLRAGRRQSMQTASARCFNAGLNELFGLPLNDWRNYDARISAVDAAALARFAKRWLRREDRLRLVIGPG